MNYVVISFNDGTVMSFDEDEMDPYEINSLREDFMSGMDRLVFSYTYEGHDVFAVVNAKNVQQISVSVEREDE